MSTNQHHNFVYVNELALDVTDGLFHSVADMVKVTGQSISGFIEEMLEPVQSIEPNVNPVELAKGKGGGDRCNKTRALGGSLGFSPRAFAACKNTHPHNHSCFCPGVYEKN
ncbi:hypothetical protein [Pedobacter sp. ASV28]|uniref:hypothetical protein n=1 Tax=Pedobacter sp. ASV28 TaxID=2795123 RepID=UPI0018EC2017|nr:hypothetical protein [Pedobacter sp. ASV28]